MILEILSYLPLASAAWCAGLAVFVFSRSPKNITNILFAMGMTSFAVLEIGQAAIIDTLANAGLILIPGSWYIFSKVFGRENPSGHLSRSRWAIALACLATPLFLYATISPPDLLFEGSGAVLQLSLSIYSIAYLAFAITNFESTFRSADHRQRWRIKYLIIGISAVLLFRIYAIAYQLLYPLQVVDFTDFYATIILIGCALISFSLVRHRLLNVNVFISRDMAYRSFSVAFIGGSFIFIAIIAQLVRSYGGDFSFYLSYLFVFLSALLLVVLSLSETVRKRTRRFLYENFYQFKYDYRKEWLDWTNRLSAKVGIEDLPPIIEKMVYDYFWIGKAVLWVEDDSDGGYRIVKPNDESPYNVLHLEPAFESILRETDFPLLLDQENRETSSLKKDTGIASSGVSILVPVVIDEHLLGILGFSGSGHKNPLHQEDYELMRVIAKQVGNAILHARLTEKLLRSKEKEAFHSFSAFVLHDLKNFISMLSLMLENMDKRYDDPAFRNDMMLGISGTVEKMKRLIEHVSLFSREPSLNRKRIDLNHVIRECIREMRGSARSRIVENYQAVSETDVDPDLIKKVIINLVMNADEANPSDGEIHVRTSSGKGNIAVSVSDNGCGIPKEYIEKKLFRMFSTTKSTGFGVGLFQSKQIVEAHGGKIQVESTVGKGTTFTILLPIPEAR